MSKTPQQRIGKQMTKLGIDARHFPTIQAEFDAGKFQASEKGTGRAVRKYLEKNHGDWVTTKPADKPAGDNGGGKVNPFHPASFNFSEQMRLAKVSPELAANLAASVGPGAALGMTIEQARKAAAAKKAMADV